MNSLQPSPAQERWLTLAARWPKYQNSQSVKVGTAGWTTVNFLIRCAFFLLGMIAAIAVSAICAIAFHERFKIIGGVALLLAGEYLIVGKRLAAAGAEEALIVTAYVLIVIGIITVDHSDDISVAFGVAIAIILAGMRVRNPLLTTLGAITFSFAIAFSLGFTIWGASPVIPHVDLWVSLYCYMLAAIALLSGVRQFQRPSYDRMLDWLVIAMPLMGYAWSIDYKSSGFRWDTHTAMQWYIVLMPLLFATVGIFLSLRRHTHAPLFAAIGCVACVAYELRNLTGMPLQWRLITWGSLMLVSGSIAEQLLRVSRHGITSRQLDDCNTVLDAAEIVGTTLITPVNNNTIVEPTPMEGGGGSFSGGGASGRY